MLLYLSIQSLLILYELFLPGLLLCNFLLHVLYLSLSVSFLRCSFGLALLNINFMCYYCICIYSALAKWG